MNRKTRILECTYIYLEKILSELQDSYNDLNDSIKEFIKDGSDVSPIINKTERLLIDIKDTKLKIENKYIFVPISQNQFCEIGNTVVLESSRSPIKEIFLGDYATNKTNTTTIGSPVWELLKGKQVGEIIELNNSKIKIVNIYDYDYGVTKFFPEVRERN